MNSYAWYYLKFRPSRSILTIASVGLCTVLMTFLISVYRGVADGTLDYVRQNHCNFWVLQENATNIVRGSSILLAKHAKLLNSMKGIVSCSPILLTLSVVQTSETEGTVYLVGYDPSKPLGGPPRIVTGRDVNSEFEIVLDNCFAAKYNISVGDTITCNRRNLGVVGLSDGTNAFVIQYAFVTLSTAQKLMGDLKIVSAYLVTIADINQAASVADEIRKVIPRSSVFSQDEFVANNHREMQSGFLPFIVAVCVISIGVLIIILSLLLSLMIIERRGDFAVMKTIGAPSIFLPGLVLNLAALVAIAGVTTGLMLFAPVTALVRQIAPELHTVTTGLELALVSLSVVAACLLSAVVPLRKLRSIYPAETFQ